MKINVNISGHDSVPKNIHTVFHTVFHADFHCNLGVTHKIIHTIFHTVVAGSCFTPVLTATFGATHFNHSVCTLGSWGDSCGSTNHLVCPQDLLWIRQNPCGPTRLPVGPPGPQKKYMNISLHCCSENHGCTSILVCVVAVRPRGRAAARPHRRAAARPCGHAAARPSRPPEGAPREPQRRPN